MRGIRTIGTVLLLSLVRVAFSQTTQLAPTTRSGHASLTFEYEPGKYRTVQWSGTAGREQSEQEKAAARHALQVRNALLAERLLARAAPPNDITVFFSPDGGCTDAIVREINQARQQVVMQAYTFTSIPIATALVNARGRGVLVAVIFDKGMQGAERGIARLLTSNGVVVAVDAQTGIAHNKIVVVDSATVITGSFNFTDAAEHHNAENLIVVRRPDVAAAYVNNFNQNWQNTIAYDRGEDGK